MYTNTGEMIRRDGDEVELDGNTEYNPVLMRKREKRVGDPEWGVVWLFMVLSDGRVECIGRNWDE